MTDNRKRILEMLADKKIDVDEAYRLLSLVGGSEECGETGEARQEQRKRPGKYLRIQVEPMGEGGEERSGADRVNIRVPMALIRAGMKLTSLIPDKAAGHVNDALREKGVDADLRKIKAEDIEQILEAIGELEVDVESGKERQNVKIYVE